jgi:putative transposase
MTEDHDRSALTDQQRDQAYRRFGVIRPFLEDGVPLASVAREQSIPLRTLEDWVRAYRRDGLRGLARKRRSDVGRRQFPPELQALIEGLALQRPAPSAAAIARQILPIAQQHHWRVPSYRTILAIIAAIPPPLVTMAHEGPKAYSDRFDLIHRRDAAQPNEIWQADHTPLDIRLLNDRGQAARPWLTIILDDYSRAIAGYFLSFQHPSAIHTALALRQAIWRKSEAHWQICGIPETFYTDHGSDFTSRHIEQVAADLKFRVQFAHSARGKGKIERFFGTVNQLFLGDQPGYSPPNGPVGTASLTMADFEARFRHFLLEVYHQRIHSEIAMPPQTRWAQHGFLPRMPESAEHLDHLLLRVAKSRRVQPDGIRFQGLRYMDLTLAAYVGEDVIIRYDPRDMAEIRVYHQDAFLCRAVCHAIAGETLALKDLIRARKQQQRHITTTLRQRAAAVEALLPAVPAVEAESAEPPPDDDSTPRLKRYYHD